ncbi:MAG: SCO family protein [Pseudomonadota bacterium]
MKRNFVWLAALAAGLATGGMVTWVMHEPPAKQEAARAPVAAFVPSLDNTTGFPNIKGGDFQLINQSGNERTSKDPEGRYQLLFFGYAKCNAICSVALPNMTEAVSVLEGLGHTVTPVMVTVDPERDTVDALADAMPAMHPRMVGLTGSEDALNAAYKAFQIQKQFVFEHPDEGPVYTHGSFVYLLDGQGNFKTLFPPITSPVRIAEITSGYIAEGES